MNRLWVRLSLVVVFVVFFITLTPIVLRSLNRPDNPPYNPQRMDAQEMSEEEMAAFEASMERRIWQEVSGRLLVGGILALAAGVIASRWLVAPLGRLEDGAQAVAEHQLEHRVPERGSKEMKSVAASFNRMADKLEEQENLRRNLLADVTHELRHPIHIIQGNLQAILDGVFPLEKGEIARLLDQTQQLTSLVEDLHQIALAEARQLPLHKQDSDLVETIRGALTSAQSMLSSKNITLETTMPPHAVIREVDGVRIRQAFQNILNNAFHHTPQGEKIAVGLSETREGVEISVQDWGEGIPHEHIPHIFDRFYRSDNSRNREYGGAGLGLAISQAIIRSHGGEIRASSPGPGQGSKFTITLP